jgi:hypothetical protein
MTIAGALSLITRSARNGHRARNSLRISKYRSLTWASETWKSRDRSSPSKIPVPGAVFTLRSHRTDTTLSSQNGLIFSLSLLQWQGGAVGRSDAVRALGTAAR